jgi:phosphatidylinositol alpha 1,6-mannosyltransferase
VDLDRYHPRNRAMEDAVALRHRVAPAGETVVGYVGRIAPEKQLERLQALRGIHGVRFLIAGDGPSQASARRALAGMPVTWLGRVGGRELAAAYAAMDVFVHTGTEETFGQTVQEAHASGLPVVAPYAGGPIDLVDHGTDGFLFDPASPRDADLRRLVDELVASEPMRLRMGEAGRRAVLGRSWATIGDELIGHYDRAVSARRSALHAPDPAGAGPVAVGA